MQLHPPLSATARPFQPGPLRCPPWWMIHPEITLLRMDYQGAVLLGVVLVVCPLERPPPATTTPLMRMGCPPIPPSLTGPLAGGVGAEEAEVTRVVVTLMKLAPPKVGERKRMDFLVRSKSLNFEVRRVILIMWPTPLGSGPVVSLTTMTIMRIPTPCP